ncbi:MAG: TonB-dependent receptor plug domain-containing protein [Saprospiraceae bacterium]|nr:TonB-dependent receptor plug domain-containing protein [Saprospiraceae bacterium]
MIREVKELNQVEVSSEAANKNVQSTQQGVSRMSIATIKRLPTLFGEVDVIRSVQTLPGVTTVGEGAGGFNVRGGNIDQNLILMDDIPIFNTSHLMGFFSIFNPDAVRDMTLYRGGIPPQYGGRNSSVLDIKLKEPDWDSLRLFGGFSLMASRGGVEIPIVKQKASLLLAGRISYANTFFSFFENPIISKTRASFSDLTGKFRWQINKKNFFYLTSYFSYDDFKVAGDSLAGLDIDASSTLFRWGTQAASARWYHIWRDGLISNTSIIYSRYAPTMEITDTSFAGELVSYIEHRQIKSDFKWVKNAKHTFDFGISAINYRLRPNSLTPTLPSSNLNAITLPDESAYEAALYFNDEFKINKLDTGLGLRYSAFALIGPSNVLKYDETIAREPFTVTDSILYSNGEIVKLYHYAEPRLFAQN